ncbi:MAG: glycoside hydrolase family 105 protein [bacterium]
MKNKLSHLIKYIFLIVVVLLGSFLRALAQNSTPIQVVKLIADRVIQESKFDFDLVPQKEVLDIQVIDFNQIYGDKVSGVGYALSYIVSEKDTTVTIGVSNSDAIKIWVNDHQVFQQNKNRLTHFKEIAYTYFVFQDTFKVDLQKGTNKILVKVASSQKEWKFLLRFVTAPGMDVTALKFSLHPISSYFDGSKWLCIGPFPNPVINGRSGGHDIRYPPESEYSEYYNFEDVIYSWKTPVKNVLVELAIEPTNTYKRDSYLEWHYANGTTMMGIIALADQTGDRRYLNFVKRFCDFTLEHMDYFRWQYASLHAFRGTNHRLFRRTMLDDSSAPALPLLDMYLHDPERKYKQLIQSIAEYVSNQQVRLDDGTFCRPEPESGTVWADDLFMSVPFLLRMGKMTGNQSYYDAVAFQIIQFARRLFDSDKELFYHCWYQSSQKTSDVKWGRANGWMIWALSEALTHLPKTHADYEEIMNIFRHHVAGLAKYQDASGMWHQVLDHTESYEETSCTAMFVLGIARGIRHGWIEKKYKKNVLKGWEALQGKIDSSGIVYGICRGTGVGDNLNFYFNRNTFPNDPRGLGAVMVAGVEISKLNK